MPMKLDTIARIAQETPIRIWVVMGVLRVLIVKEHLWIMPCIVSAIVMLGIYVKEDLCKGEVTV